MDVSVLSLLVQTAAHVPPETAYPLLVTHPEHSGGRLFRGQRVWAALDLLLTCSTVAEARDRTRERVRQAGEAV